ncbi:hypothetical protein CJU90_5510 [Yarrowia sp. C11]|nr:hypothetical protein CJU90_5510 [Yarrowia sp. C11]KAG5364099.1 hypothetical protein CKK34_2888 [Yarrowia sp. E02]
MPMPPVGPPVQGLSHLLPHQLVHAIGEIGADGKSALHDEVDVVSPRDIAAMRYMRHYEWMELVTGATSVGAKGLKLTAPRGIPVYDIKKKLEETQKEVEELKSQRPTDIDDEKSEFYKSEILRLRESFGDDSEIDTVKRLHEKFNLTVHESGKLRPVKVNLAVSTKRRSDVDAAQVQRAEQLIQERLGPQQQQQQQQLQQGQQGQQQGQGMDQNQQYAMDGQQQQQQQQQQHGQRPQGMMQQGQMQQGQMQHGQMQGMGQDMGMQMPLMDDMLLNDMEIPDHVMEQQMADQLGGEMMGDGLDMDMDVDLDLNYE